MTRRVWRGAWALGALVLVPACNLTFTQDPGEDPGAGGGFPFALQLPVDGSLNELTNPQFSWTAAPGAQGYELQISTAPDFSTLLWDDPTLTSTSVFLQPTLTNFTTYYWRIYATQPGAPPLLAGGSPYSFRTLGGGFTIPTLFSTLSPQNGLSGVSLTPFFTWDPSTGAESYRLQIDTGTSFTSPVVDLPGIQINQVSCPSSLAPTTLYHWRVIAVGSLGSTTSNAPATMFGTGP